MVSFGNNVDLIGFSLSIVSKITALASANTVFIGQCLFEQISSTQGFTKELHPSDYHVMKWNRVGNIQGNMIYRIYSLVQPYPQKTWHVDHVTQNVIESEAETASLVSLNYI